MDVRSDKEKIKKLELLMDQNPNWTVGGLVKEIGESPRWVRAKIKGIELAKKIKKKLEDNPDITVSMIAEELDVFPAQVYHQIQLHGMDYSERKHTKINDRVVENLKTLVSKHPDWTVSQLSKELDVSATSVWHIIKDNNIEYTPKVIKNKVDVEKLKEEIKSNPQWSVKQLAEKLGVSENTIRRKIEKYNIEYTPKVIKNKVDVEKLKEEIKSNPQWSVKQLAEKLGVSENTIRRKIEKYNIEYTPKVIKNKVDVEKLKEEIKNNPQWSVKQLAEKLGVSENTIRRKIEKYNIEYTPKVIKNKVDVEKLKEEIKNNPKWTVKQLAEKFGVAENTIRRNIEKHNIVRD
ncbi:HTH domain-containing protein [Bacillus licheniformis]|uniref:HTH domain-containing protein n=3 Tax=Bacillus subtilis group TaxID=653685 RepID=UPI000E4AEC58|nr:HTH domain-containing protein [Bacillus licheniformis]RHL12359.1 HTH domain-containing protein [Bacillus licheniformis]